MSNVLNYKVVAYSGAALCLNGEVGYKNRHLHNKDLIYQLLGRQIMWQWTLRCATEGII